MEPRSIEGQEICIGDTVRAEANTTTVAGRVTSFDGFKIVIGGIVRLERGAWSWTLLHRPEPPREVGSRWHDPETDVDYILTDHLRNEEFPLYVPYRNCRDATAVAREWSERDRVVVDRLVPLDGE